MCVIYRRLDKTCNEKRQLYAGSLVLLPRQVCFSETCTVARAFMCIASPHAFSYDTWVADIHVETDVPESIPTTEPPYHVDARWLLALDEFNEFMNEEDYAADEVM